MQLLLFLVNWYIMLGLRAEMTSIDTNNGTTLRHSHVRLMEDLEEYFQNFTKQLEIAIRDYIIEMAVDEALNTEYTNGRILYSKGDYRTCSIVTLRKGLTDLFLNYWWDSNFGGKLWGKAVALTESTGINFIDSVIDLHHNNGVLFNKRFYLWTGMDNYHEIAFQNFLTHKFSENIDYLSIFYKELVCKDVSKFLQRFYNLYRRKGNPEFDWQERHDYEWAVKVVRMYVEPSINKLLAYKPVCRENWGKAWTAQYFVSAEEFHSAGVQLSQDDLDYINKWKKLPE